MRTILLIITSIVFTSCSFLEGVRQSDTNVKTSVNTRFGKFTYDSKSTVNQGP